MKRRYQSNDTSPSNHHDLSKKTAIHEAGHAAAVYLRNKQKQLPPIFFEIFIKEHGQITSQNNNHEPCIAKVEGGRLIHSLPNSLEDAILELQPQQQQAYLLAFEADIINIMAGPLAEAKYVALRDGELINPYLVNFDALQNYGGLSDVETVNEYLECYSSCNTERKTKASALFLDAFEFINDTQNWSAIEALGSYLQANPKNIIGCEEIMAVIDCAIDDKNRPQYDNFWLSTINDSAWLQTKPSPL